MIGLEGRRWWLACVLVFGLALLANVPTAGDLGLTYDEPVYRTCQLLSAQWWERLVQARSKAEFRAVLEPDALLYYWPYARFGINFHPPLAGQLNLLTFELFGSFMKDIPARRMASVLEFSLTLTILFGFLARRYGGWVGGVASASLLLMPRIYGQAHLADTDTPGLLIWASASVVFWKGLYESKARAWRVALGLLMGLAFVEKMGTVVVLLPILGWLVIGYLPGSFRKGGRAAWIDGTLTIGAMLVPLILAYLEVRRLSVAFLAIQVQRTLHDPTARISPSRTDLFRDHPPSFLLAAILAVPLMVWIVRRLLGRTFRNHPVWGVERPALEIVAAILGFAPVVAWLGNPAWWRLTLPRLAHYYAICTARRGVLPDIQILYFGQIYEYSLPWPNAWVLIAITVPVGILAAALVGLLFVVRSLGRDRLPLYFLVQLATLPILRMFPTPAHDGVRLFLPTFFFLAALAGWGLVWLADGLAAALRFRVPHSAFRIGLAALVLGPAAWQLVAIHPFELSYYNALIGGPRGAWHAGFELSYWYDAFNSRTLDEINRKLPKGARVEFPSLLSGPSTFQELQSLGRLRGDIQLGGSRLDEFPYCWLLTHDSKAMAFSRLLFALRPYYARCPSQLDGLRVATVTDPVAGARALALQLLLDAPDLGPPEAPGAPAWVRKRLPWLARLWGDGVPKIHRLTVHEPMFEWARTDPDGLRAAARIIADWARTDRDGFRITIETLTQWDRSRPDGFEAALRSILARRPFTEHPGAARLYRALTRYDREHPFSAKLLLGRPEALEEVAAILARRPEAVRRVMLRHGLTDPETIGGYLDRDLETGKPD